MLNIQFILQNLTKIATNLYFQEYITSHIQNSPVKRCLHQSHQGPTQQMGQKCYIFFLFRDDRKLTT
ncbi:hypothetical protein HanIR_Chr04g0192691 [Helianthus annuus]|nr:hypothetical protein HanIR_Chr04g0192691 [Helianthus annuus]